MDAFTAKIEALEHHRAGSDDLQLGAALGVANFAALDTSSNGVLDDADANVYIAGDDTIIQLGAQQIHLVGATGLAGSDFLFA